MAKEELGLAGVVKISVEQSSKLENSTVQFFKDLNMKVEKGVGKRGIVDSYVSKHLVEEKSTSASFLIITVNSFEEVIRKIKALAK